jgi:hypothetical protein
LRLCVCCTVAMPRPYDEPLQGFARERWWYEDEPEQGLQRMMRRSDQMMRPGARVRQCVMGAVGLVGQVESRF